MHMISESSIKNYFEKIIALTKGCHCKKKMIFLFVYIGLCVSVDSSASPLIQTKAKSCFPCDNQMSVEICCFFFFILIEIIQHNSNKPRRAMFQCFMDWDKIVCVRCTSFRSEIQ